MSLIQADARHMPLADGCVQMCVTSPPYFGLRDYGIAQQIGLEPSPDVYVAALVDVFRDVRRVLAADGVLFLNLGDSYAGSGKARGSGGIGPKSQKQTTNRGAYFQSEQPIQFDGFKPKDLLGVPWRVAFALQADGWYLRSDIIWSKPNPMPESVTDRPTKAHEYLFLLSKQASYYYDADAIAEQASEAMLIQMEQGYDGLGLKDYAAAGVQNPSSVKARIIANARRRVAPQPKQDALGNQQGGYLGTNAPFLTRNKRTVWTINTMPYSGAHFATMPEKLVEPCILAGSRFGDRILDPFSGSGTVGAVAERLGRRWVGLDLNPAYHQLAKQRTAQRGIRFEVA